MTQPPEFPPPSPYPHDPAPPVPPQFPYPQSPRGAPPPYGQQPWYRQNRPIPPGTNGFAIAALVFGIIPICFLGIVFGIVALVQVGKSGQRGKGLAIAGLVVSGVWLLLIAIGGLANLLETAERGESGSVTEDGKVFAQDMKIGDCIDDLPEGDSVFRISVVPCAEPHAGEVYAHVHVSGSEFPGVDELTDQANEDCFEKLQAQAPKAFQDERVGVYFLYPRERSWSQGDRMITCIATTENKRTGSIRD